MRLKADASEAEIRAVESHIARRRARTKLSEHGITLARQHGWWDPYTLSKAMAEMRLMEASTSSGVPLVIVRPTGIICCAQQPKPGWIDCYLLNEPIIEAEGKGQLTAFPGRQDSLLDLVPADFVVEHIIVAATQPPTAGGVAKVYQAASGDVNPVYQGDLALWWAEYFREYPFRDPRGKPMKPVVPQLIGSLDEFVSRMYWRAGAPLAAAGSLARWLPGSAEWAQNLRSRIAKMHAAYENAIRLAKLYSVYTLERFRFQSSNSRELLENLPAEDRRRFYSANCSDIDWKAYFRELHIPGMRKYVLKDGAVEPLGLDKRALAQRRPPLSRL